MTETNDKVKKNPLDTSLMHEKLKGDSFPQNWEDFLDDDIREFFDQSLNVTGQKKSNVIRKANLSRVYGYQIMEGRRRGKRDCYLLIALAKIPCMHFPKGWPFVNSLDLYYPMPGNRQH